MTSTGPPPGETGTEPSTRATLARLWNDYLRPRWPMMLLSLVLAGIAGALTALLMKVLEPAVDQLVVAKNREAMTTIPLTILAIAVPRALCQFIQPQIVNRLGHGLVSQIQVQLFGKLINADLARLQTGHTGSYVSSVLFDANLIRQSATDGLAKFTQNALITLFLAIWLLTIDLVLGGLVLIVAPIVNGVLRRFSRRTRKAVRGAMAETSNLSTAVMESLDGIKIVKLEGREDFEQQRVEEVSRRRQKHLIKSSTTKASLGPTTELIMSFVMAGILVYAGWRAQQGALSPGMLLSFIASLLTLGQAIREMAAQTGVMTEGLAAARRLFDAMDVQPKIQDPSSPRPIPDGPCSVEFADVTFSYRGDAPALNGLSLKAAPGETIALVGPSGSGKSTVLNMIPRFYDADSGAILVNGLDVREASLRDLRSRIALVSQEPFLFDDTVRANIAYVRPGATNDQIEAAARAAAASEFIDSLPEGYETRVGEAGSRLSGGQRQRIAIARAFLKDAPILLLDEATSALDTESEAKVQEALERLMVGRTTFIVAHRLATVRHAHRIYVIEAGRTVEQGTHTTLLRKGGLYARLAKGQDLEAPAPAAADA